MSTTFDLDISVSEHATRNAFTAHINGNYLDGITMRLKPEGAFLIAKALMSELEPVIAWRMHPLYQWGKRKTDKPEG